MTTCDVLIVGGGPAGSSCAERLRRAGLDVLILDKKAFPRDKPCAGWITPAVVDLVRLDLDDYRRGRVLEPITGFCTSVMGGREVTTDYGKPISYGIRRFEFDHYLLQRCGARFQPEAAKTFERDGAGWVVNGAYRAKLLVGAGGHFCPVARSLGGGSGRGETAVMAQEIEVEMDARQLAERPIPAGVPYFYFCEDLKGYGWYYRKGNYLNVGLGREDDRNLSTHVHAFCDYLKKAAKIPGDLAARFVGHAYLLYPHAPRQVVDDAMLLIGDAAGMAYVPSGEGIRPAVESGLMAADAIVAAAGDYGRARLDPYRRRLTARFGKRGDGPGRDLLPAGLKRFIAGRLMASRWFTRHVVLDRWFLRRHEPALV